MPRTDVVTTPPAGDLVSTAAGPEVTRLAATAAAYSEAQMATATRRAYQSDWADFAAWCGNNPSDDLGQAITRLPASGRAVALYIAHLAESGLAASTIERRLAAIRTIHKLADQAPPASSELRAVWAGIRRTHGRPPRQKRAIITEDLRRIVARLPANPIGVRDKALILTCYAAALRRSEAAALVLDDGKSRGRAIRLDFVARGFRISLDASKADQEGQGAVVAVPYGKTKLCAGVALRAWLDLANITSGPVFRPVTRHGRIEPRAMTDKAVADAIKRACARVKIDPAMIGGHSLRAGMVTQAIMNDVAVPTIMKQTRHAKVDTMNRYVRMAADMDKSAGGKLGL